MTERPNTSTDGVPSFIKLLAHDLRWTMLRALAHGDYQVNELVAIVEQPMNLVSYHLKQLRDDGLVMTRRSESDGRDIYYSLDVDALRERFHDSGLTLHPALVIDAAAMPTTDLAPVRVLFVCTNNSARSQMAEGLLRHLSGGRVTAFSAGNHPGDIHPDAITTMHAIGIDITGQHSKHLNTFNGQTFDYVVTVCDLAREVCPTFDGQAVYVHWGFSDPVRITDEIERKAQFQQTAARLKSRITHFLAGINTSQRRLIS